MQKKSAKSLIENSHTLAVQDVLRRLKVDSAKGLTDAQVRKRQEEFGRNELEEEEGTPLWRLVLEQFQDQLVQILLLAAIVSFVLACFEDEKGRWSAFVEPAVILLILVANAIVGVVQESNAEKAIDALKTYAPDEAKVLRNGHIERIPASELVPGDIVELHVGDRIPADLRVIDITSTALRVDQALLTGESTSVQKLASVVVKDVGAVKQDQVNILFAGTTITMGRARCIVVKTGAETAMGEIHQSISSQIEEKTPLKRRLDDFGDQLAKIISVICVLVWLINVRHFSDSIHGGVIRGAIYYFKIAVALAVAAIPEGLAVVITTCLALGTKKMARNNAIVRTLPSVETLGCTSVICSDKTGTLTTNRMCVTRILIVEGTRLLEFEVEGSNYAPHGAIREVVSSEIFDQKLMNNGSALFELAKVCSLCNDAQIVYDDKSKDYENVGEPTEAALKVLVEKLCLDDLDGGKALTGRNRKLKTNVFNAHLAGLYERVATFDFDRDRKSMSVLVKDPESPDFTLLVKGAPESILERCTQYLTATGSVSPLNTTMKKRITDAFTAYGQGEALRVLAMAVKDSMPSPEKLAKTINTPKAFSELEKDMTFVGLVGMLDPPREEVRESIRQCQDAGIRVIVITGDNQATAESICRKIGIFGDDEDIRGKSITGREFDSMTSEQQREIVQYARLFSRTESSHKHRLVKLLQDAGMVVAMTGDGVNDAPALKKADIGVAMGSGTDVAKLAADMVLADDNFATIVKAVEEGRSIYNNTKQFIRYLISSNIGEVVSIFLTVLLGMPEALIPVQLLWVNLVTDGLPATALGFNPPDHEIMKHPPREAREPIVSKWLLFRYCIIGAYVGLATVGGYAWWFMFASAGPKISLSQLVTSLFLFDVYMVYVLLDEL